jgi:hypothetical protein
MTRFVATLGKQGPAGTTGPQGPPGPGATLSDAAAQALGVAAAGTSTDASRADHVHPMPNAAAVGAMSTVAGTNGGVLAYVSGAWVSTGAGTAGQHLKSNGSGAPTWETPSGGDAPPTGAQWYDATKAAFVIMSSLPSAFSGNYTTGIRFRVLTSRSIVGAKFYWASATATTVKVAVWQSGVLIASENVSVSGVGDYTATFAAPAALATGTTYTLSIYDTSATSYMANGSMNRQSPEFGAGWVRLIGYGYSAGDAEPASGMIVTSTMLLAPVF